MVQCDYCEEEFDSEEELHRHWGEEHEEELNSHQKEKVKKANRKLEEQKDAKMRKRKQYAGYGLGIALVVALVGVVGAQLMSGGGNTSALDNLNNQPTMGPENASVTVVEFGDYKCPYCRQFETQVFPQIKENYIDTGKVNFKFVNYAFLGPSSQRAAVAAECVYNQDKQAFWSYHKALYEAQGPESQDWATKELLVDVARDNTEGLNYNQLDQCISSQNTLSKVQRDLSIGNNAGVSGTPSVYVNGQKVQNALSYNAIRTVIDSELQK